MLKSERMSKAVIISPKSYQSKIVKELYNLKAIHILNHLKDEMDIGNPLPNASAISETLISVRAIISNLNLEGDVALRNGFRAIGVKNFAHLASTVKKLQEQTNTQLEKIRQTENAISGNARAISLLEKIEALRLPLDACSPYKSLAVFAGDVEAPQTLAKGMQQITDEFELRQSEKTMALFVARPYEARAEELLAKHNFSEMDLSHITGLKGEPAEQIRKLAAELEKSEKSLREAKKAIESLGNKWHDFLILSEKFLSAELEKAEAPLRFAASQNIIVITGWVPTKYTGKLTETIAKITEGHAEMEVSKPSHDDSVPVKLANAKLSKPYEFLLNLYALPKYSEIDPTLFLFLTFPLFFGIILGDIGYGLVILALLFYMPKKYPGMKPIAKIMLPAALSSVIFGFLFGEIFGFEELLGFHLPHVLSRIHQVREMLAFSVFIGLLHINLGLLLGFVNELEHGLRKALLAKGSWWLLQISILGIWLTASGQIALPIYASIAAAIISAALIYMGESITGIIEIPGLISNLISYTRLAAVGLASVGLAVVVNSFMEDFINAGGIMAVAGVAIGIFGHALNIALGLLGGFLQSIRLNYVEFFTKFFKGGAVPYYPFGKKLDEAAQ